MNYQKIYNQLLERGKVRNFTNRKEIYFEKHHIIPKSLGGKNDKINLVNLTAREHFLAHWLLHRIYPTNKSLSYAFYRCMKGVSKQRNFTPSSRVYEEARIDLSLLLKGVKLSKERCNLIKIGVNNSEKFQKAVRSKERGNKVSKALLNRPFSEKRIKNMSIAQTKRFKTEDIWSKNKKVGREAADKAWITRRLNQQLKIN